MHRFRNTRRLRAEVAWFVCVGLVLCAWPVWDLVTLVWTTPAGVLIDLLMFASGVSALTRAEAVRRNLTDRPLTRWERKILAELQQRHPSPISPR